MLGNIVRNALGRLRPVTTVDQVRTLIDSGRLDEALEKSAHLHSGTPRLELTRTALQAEIAFRQGRDQEAETHFKQVLAEDPGHAHAHYGLSLLLYERGESDSALRHAQFAHNVDTLDARYAAQLGLCNVQQGNYPVAEGQLRSALRALPEDKSCWNNMGIVQAAKGDFKYARTCFNKALSIDPQFQSARSNLELLEAEERSGRPKLVAAESKPQVPLAALIPEDTQVPLAEDAGEGDEPWRRQWPAVVALHQAGKTEEALAAAERMTFEWPDVSQVACWVAKVYAAQGDAQGGIDTLRAFLHRYPDDKEARLSLARALAAIQEYKQAEEIIRKVIAEGDDSTTTQLQLAENLHHRERYAEAADMSRDAISRMDKPTPRMLALLAASSSMACRYEEAMAVYDELFALRGKDDSPVTGGFAMCLGYMGRFDEAADVLDQLLRFNPNEPGLRLQRAQMRLLREDFARGWDDYMFRGFSQTRFFRVLPYPRWQGEPLEGKRIVVLAEQGMGDQIMLSSCLPDLLALGPAHVYVEANQRVAATLVRSFPQCTVIGTTQGKDMDWARSVGEADYHVPLGDLPARFRRSIGDFPGKAYLHADPGRVAYWRSRIESRGPGPYIGISWRGGTEVTRTSVRSMSPGMLAPHFASLDATWINLQYGEVGQELRDAEAAGLRVHHWPESIKDLDEFAALITALDAVITVCNTTVHYAGALGRKAWVLAPHIPEWRYGLHFRQMPWYPDVTVLRQPSRGEWEPTIAQAVREAAEWLPRQARQRT